MSFGARRRARIGRLARLCAKPVLSAILLVFDQF